MHPSNGPWPLYLEKLSSFPAKFISSFWFCGLRRSLRRRPKCYVRSLVSLTFRHQPRKTSTSMLHFSVLPVRIEERDGGGNLPPRHSRCERQQATSSIWMRLLEVSKFLH